MAANEPGRSSNAVRDAAEQSNDDGAAVRGGNHERRGVDLEGGSDGAPAAAFEVAEIVSGIHRNQLRRALVEGDTNTAPVLLHGFQEAEEAEVISESSGTLRLEGSTTGDGREPGEDGAHETSELPVMGSDCFSEYKQRNSGVYWPEIPLGHNVLTSEFKLTLPIHLNHPKISSRFYCHFPQSSYFGCTPWLSLYRPWLDVFCGFV